jgi:hypothetical protein
MNFTYDYKESLLEIQSLKTDLINHFEYSDRAKIPYKVHLLIESMNCRMIDFCESIDMLIMNNHVVPAVSLIRSLFEMTAIINRISSSIEKSIIQTKLIENFDDLMMKLCFGTRYESNYNATNILSQIEKLDKKHNGVLNFYNDLCEFVHPNSDGVIGSYSELKEKDNKNLIYKAITTEHIIYPWIEKCYHLCMVTYYENVKKIFTDLPEFALICEAELNKRQNT